MANNYIPDLERRLELYDRCSICLSEGIPVICKFMTCEHVNCMCLTCVRDTFCLNGQQNSMAHGTEVTDCPKCRAPFTFQPQSSYQKYKIYDFDCELAAEKDEEGTKIKCPRGCKWEGLRSHGQAHLRKCPNTFSHRCEQCKKLFTKQQIEEHINNETICYQYYVNNDMSCEKCGIAFEKITHLKRHDASCPMKNWSKCIGCNQYMETIDPEHELPCVRQRLTALLLEMESEQRHVDNGWSMY